jgi:hypothetical protein
MRSRRRARARGARRTSRGLGLVLLSLVLCCAAVSVFPRAGRGQARSTEAPPSLDAQAAGSGAGAHQEAPVAPKAEDLLSIPTGMGLPVMVRVAVFFLDMKGFDDTKGEVECTLDLRTQWRDTRLAFPKDEALRGYKEMRGSAAETFREQHWKPRLEFANQLEASDKVGRRVRVFADGTVESLERITGKYSVLVDPQRFPFDRQHLKLVLNVLEDTTDAVVLDFTKDDVEFSRVARSASLPGWMLGLVDLRSATVAGWNGDRYSQVTASLFVDRLAETGVAPIFIPLIASLLIPLLAIWMNKPTEEGFETASAACSR